MPAPSTAVFMLRVSSAPVSRYPTALSLFLHYPAQPLKLSFDGIQPVLLTRGRRLQRIGATAGLRFDEAKPLLHIFCHATQFSVHLSAKSLFRCGRVFK